MSDDRCLLLADPGWQELVRELMMETITVARAKGFDIPESAADLHRHFTHAPKWAPTKASTLIDF